MTEAYLIKKNGSLLMQSQGRSGKYTESQLQGLSPKVVNKVMTADQKEALIKAKLQVSFSMMIKKYEVDQMYNNTMKHVKKNMKNMIKAKLMKQINAQKDVSSEDEEYVQNLKPYVPKVSIKVKQQIQELCEELDEIILNQKEQEIEKVIAMKNPKMFQHMMGQTTKKTYSLSNFSASQSNNFQQEQLDGLKAMPKSLQKLMMQKLEQMIKEKNKEIQKTREMSFQDMEIEQYDSFQANEESIVTKGDPSIKKCMKSINPEAIGFLNYLLEEVQQKTQKINTLKILESQLKALKDLQKQQSSDRFLQQMVNISGGEVELGSTNQESLSQQRSQECATPIDYKEKNLQAFLLRHMGEILIKFRKGQEGRQRVDMVFLTKIVNMHDKLEQVFPKDEFPDIGQKYEYIGKSLWTNDYLINVQNTLKAQKIHHNIEVGFNEDERNQLEINSLFEDQIEKMQFYNEAKLYNNTNSIVLSPDSSQAEIEEMQTEFNLKGNEQTLINQRYFAKSKNSDEVPFPAFDKMYQGCLFFSEFRITDCMAVALKEFLIASKDHPLKQVKKLCIDDCAMQDQQFAEILHGLAEQGDHIKQIVYANNEMGPKSIGTLQRLVPRLKSIHMTKVTCAKSCYSMLLESCVNNGVQLMKLKLSNVNLNDNIIVQHLVTLLETRRMLTHLDLSWTRLTPTQLVKISEVLMSDEDYPIRILRNLNLSYNSLYFDETKDSTLPSEEFVDNLIEYINQSRALNHLDISGMNLGRDYNPEQFVQIQEFEKHNSKAPILPLAEALSQNGILMGVHMSDNGLTSDSETFLEVLDMFGLDDQCRMPPDLNQFKINCRTGNSQALQHIIKEHTGALSAKDIECSKQMEVDAYQKHLFQSKLTKNVQNNKIINKAQTAFGIGRLETNLVDQVILTRNVNEPELIFNQSLHKDLYFDQDAGLQWKLSEKSECFVCQKHRLTMIMYQNEEIFTDSNKFPAYNEQLIEITDPNTIKSIKRSFNYTFDEAEEMSPMICGTVVNGGFSRKLKMLRADLFSVLAVSQSYQFVRHRKQTNAIKKGVHQILANQAFANMAYNLLQDQEWQQLEIFNYLKGWERVLYDKCCQNQVHDLKTINMTPNIERLKNKQKKVRSFPECDTFVYAAYLPPGLHQFIIYCPFTKRAFCKDLIVDLSQSDEYPEFPGMSELAGKARKRSTLCNVWRKWRMDSEEDNKNAFIHDIQSKESFSPEQFMKDQEDIENCKKILFENFHIIKVVQLELLLQSPRSYPEIGAEAFIHAITSEQTAQDRQHMPKAKLELAFVNGTVNDDAKGLNGTLCRGELLEMILRISQILSSAKSSPAKVASCLQDCIDRFLKPKYVNSTISSTRAKIRRSKRLNQLLYNNTVGLRMIFAEYTIWSKSGPARDQLKGHFSLQSAMNFIDTINSNGETIADIRELFVKSKQTNLKDLGKQQFYNYLEWVEFLEFICRIASSYGRQQLEVDRFAPLEIEDQVYVFLEFIWAIREKQKAPKFLLFNGNGQNGRVNTLPMQLQPGDVSKMYAPLKQTEIQEFPQLIAIADDSDVDSD